MAEVPEQEERRVSGVGDGWSQFVSLSVCDFRQSVCYFRSCDGGETGPRVTGLTRQPWCKQEWGGMQDWIQDTRTPGYPGSRSQDTQDTSVAGLEPGYPGSRSQDTQDTSVAGYQGLGDTSHPVTCRRREPGRV